MVLIRTLTEAEMGTWALFLTVTAIFEVTKNNLLKNAHIRFCSGSSDADEKVRIASSSLVINAAASALFIIFILLGSRLLSHWLNTGDALSDMLTWFIPGVACMIFFSHLEAVQQSNLDFKGVFAGYFTRQVIFFTIILFHFFSDKPFALKDLALYQSMSIAAGTAVLWLCSRRYLQNRFAPSPAWMKRILGYGGYIFGSGLMSNIFANLDQIMTATFLTPTYVAYYNAATRINGFVDIPSYAATEVIFPKLAKASVEEGPQRVRYMYERMVAILLCFTIPAAIFIILFPKFVISIIAGADYYPAALILQLYMITGLMRPMQNQAANLLNSIGKPGLCFTINTASLAVYLVINYICLTQFGFYGAAIGTLITSCLGMLAWYFIMRKEIRFEWSSIFKYILETYKALYSHAAALFSKTRQVHA